MTNMTTATARNITVNPSGLGGRAYLSGGWNTTTLVWPPAVMSSSNYTLFHLSKYNGAVKSRIFTSTRDNNWWVRREKGERLLGALTSIMCGARGVTAVGMFACALELVYIGFEFRHTRRGDSSCTSPLHALGESIPGRGTTCQPPPPSPCRLSGYDSAQSGVAFHNNWITPRVDCCGSNWVLHTDQISLYRANRVQVCTD